MPALPHKVTFPGKVRIVASPPGVDVTVRTVPDPRFSHPGFKDPGRMNPKFRGLTVSEVTVPAGYHPEYELKHPPKGRIGKHLPTKASAELKIVKDGEVAPAAALARHAELEHTHEVSEKEIRVGMRTNDEGERVPNTMTVHVRKLTGVTATSTKHPDIVGTGSDAASAVVDLQSKLAAYLAQEAAKAEAPHMATLPGDEGDGETGVTDQEEPKG